MKEAHISKLRIYPIKSLAHIEVEEIELGIHSLKNDRLFAMVDKNGRFVNGKRTHLVNQLKVEYDLPNKTIRLSNKNEDEINTFELREGNEDLDNYLSDFFDIPLNLKQNSNGQFMDIPAESSLTLVSEASLQLLQKELERYSLENIRMRFRSNIELVGVGAFWEEQLFRAPGTGMLFKIGDVEMTGISPRARCNVPPQNPTSGEIDYHFVKDMISSRNKHPQTNKKILQYGRQSYFLTVNVYVDKSEAGKKLSLNDKVEILEPVQLPAGFITSSKYA